jgi:signal transduction histidine kinase
VQDKIFELYFSTKENGSGIGLASTYQVMQWHHGAVNFESLPGQGTTFTLSLPLASLDEVRRSPAEASIITTSASVEKFVL